jgi:two-component system chemotaxis response regulator CheB
MKLNRTIRVLVMDDSAFVRQALKDLLESDPEIQVMGTASDPYEAVELIRTEVPDVITLDIEMPRVDGLTFLEKLMSQHPIPVVICSTLPEAGSNVALAALARGAVDIITKPKLGAKRFLEEARICICDVVKSASQARVKDRRAQPSSHAVYPKLTADAILPRAASHAMMQTTEKVVVVGASTGGTEALSRFLQAMPLDAPGILVVQHMPEVFTARFAERVNSLCRITVREAAGQESIVRGEALIAPGNKHLLLHRSGARYFAELREGPLVCRHRPSVDVLFRSAARYAGANAIGVIMTGMGDDGAKGMLEMKEAGAFNFAQDEASCVVYGMPAEAVKLGAVDRILPLDQLAGEVVRKCYSDHRHSESSLQER